MSIFENISLAIESLKSNKTRALLTMLGIIIGIAAVIAIMSVGNAVTTQVTESMQGIGMNNITLSIQAKQKEGRSINFGGSLGSQLTAKTPNDSDLITMTQIQQFQKAYANEIKAISLTENGGNGQIKDGHKKANISITGVNEGYSIVNNSELLAGRTITDADNARSSKIAIISDKAAIKIFGNVNNSIGKEIKTYVDNNIKTFTVIGVYEYKSMGPAGYANEDDVVTSVYIPISIVKTDASYKNYTSITIMTKTGVDGGTFTSKTQKYFDRFYVSNNDWEVYVMNLADAMDSMSDVLGTLSLAIAVIAGISLLVGGIGIMNIMLVSVTERTHEIGVRKALGAKNSHIRVQFIVEAVIVSLIGGIIGLIIGIAGGVLGALAMGTDPAITLSSIILSMGFSILIGLFFGYQPANKAAKLLPVDALRYE